MPPHADEPQEGLHHARRFAGPRSGAASPRDAAYARAYRQWMRAHKLLGLAVSLYALLMLVGLGQSGPLSESLGASLGFWRLIALLLLAPALLFALLALAARPLGLALAGLHVIMLVLLVVFGGLGLFFWAAVFLPL